MTPKPMPVWPLPVMAFAQVWVGTALLAPLREHGAPWDVGYAALSAIGSLAGLLVLALAVRNCMRLWQVRPQEASLALIAVTLLVALFSALWATGPMSIGVWRWESVIPGALAAYLVVVLARELRRWRRRSGKPQLS